MPHPIPSFNDPDRLADFVESKGTGWVITRLKEVQNLKLRGEVLADEPELPWQSRSQDGSRLVLVKVRWPKARSQLTRAPRDT